MFKYLLTALLLLCMSTTAQALTSTKFGWTPNSESNLDGYKILYGTVQEEYQTTEEADDVGLPTIIDGQVVAEITGFTEGTTYYGVALAYDTDGFPSDYSREVIWTVPIDTYDVIIDNSSSTSVSSTGLWELSKAVSPYNFDSVFSKEPEATFTFQSEINGQSKISMWWTEHSNRHTDVRIEVYDGTTLLDHKFINQRINGGLWNEIGTYNFNSVAKVVILANNPLGVNSVCADAVRFTTTQYPVILPEDITIEFADASVYTGTIYIGTTDKDITLTWPIVSGATTYSYRLYDINKKAFMQTGSVTTASVMFRLPATGLYRLDIKADNMIDWVSVPARLSGWPAGAGNLDLF